VKVLIVDDQTHARETLIGLCECSDDLQVVGEAACGKAAIDSARTLNPDIMFLDVELPDMSGFDLLRAATPGTRPLGIMISNCADHATRAFEEGAFDYLVMPVAAERFIAPVIGSSTRNQGLIVFLRFPHSSVALCRFHHGF